MREILFRAKCIDNGEWVYGVPIRKALAGSHDGYYPKIIPECDGRHQTIYSTAIKEETLGQYTGLCDKNGTKIFEHDIVRIAVCGTYDNYVISYDKENARFVVGDTGFTFWGYISTKIEVIGNVHDGGAVERRCRK